MADINYKVTIDTAELNRQTREVADRFKKMGNDIAKEGQKIDSVWKQVESGIPKSALKNIETLSNDVFGNFSTKAQQLSKDIQEDILTLGQLEKMQNVLNDAYEKGEVSLDSYLTTQARLSVLHDEIANAITNNEQALRRESASISIEEDSIAGLQSKVALLTAEYTRLSQARREGLEGEKLLKDISEIQTKLQSATTAMSKYGSDAGRQFNGLSVSMQQIARELPVIAMGPQMFFMAISNNLPIFADELARARKEYALLQAKGKKGTPVWKQVASSLFSWQTALIAGITLLTMHGDEIVKWVGNLFKGKEAAVDMTEVLENMNDAMDYKSVGTQIADFKRLQKAWIDLGGDIDQQKKFIEENREELDKTGISILSVVDAENIFEKNSQNYINSLTLRAKATAGLKLASEQYSKAVEKEINNQEKRKKLEDRLEYLKNRSVVNPNAAVIYDEDWNIIGGTKAISEIEKEIKAIDEEKESFVELGDAYIETSEKMTEAARSATENSGLNSIVDTEKAKKEAEKAKQAAVKAQKAIDDAILKARQAANNAELELEKKKTTSKIELLQIEKRQVIDAINQQIREARSAEEKAALWKQKQAISLSYDIDINNAFDEAQKEMQKDLAEQADSLVETIENEEQALNDYLLKYGTFREKLQATNDKYVRAIAEAGTEGERQALMADKNRVIAELEVQGSQWAKNILTLTSDRLTKLIEQTKVKLEEAQNAYNQLESSSSEEAKSLLGTINKLSAEITVLENASGHAKKAVKDDSWAEAATGFEAIASGGREAVEGIREFDEGLADSLTTIVNLSTGAVQLSNSISAIKKEKSFGNIMGGVTAGISLLSSVVKIVAQNRKEEQKHEQALIELQQRRIDQQREYNNLLLEQNLLYEKGNTIFGDDVYGRAANAINVYRGSLSLLKEALKGTEEQQKKFEKGNTGSTGFRMLDRILGRQKYSSQKDLYSGLADIQVVSGSRTERYGFLGIKKRQVDVYSSILDVYPDLISAEGEFNKELAQSILNTEKLDDASKKSLESIVETAEQAEEALQSVRDYLTDIFGELGNTMTDVLVNAFTEGTDAAEVFSDSVTDILEKLAKNMVYSVMLAPIFEQAQKEMEEIWNSGFSNQHKFTSMSSILQNMFKTFVCYITSFYYVF